MSGVRESVISDAAGGLRDIDYGGGENWEARSNF
jgi:hypothetical protein